MGLVCNEKIVLTNYIEWILFASIYGIIITIFIIIVNVTLNKKLSKEIYNCIKEKIR